VLAPPVELPIEGTIRVGTREGQARGLLARQSGGKLHARGLLEPGKPREVSGLVEDPGRPRPWRCARRSRARRSPSATMPSRATSSVRAPLDAARGAGPDAQGVEQLPRGAAAARARPPEGRRRLVRGGRRVVEEFLEKGFGALPEGLELADGSGLSRDNRVTPTLLASVLRVIAAARTSTTSGRGSRPAASTARSTSASRTRPCRPCVREDRLHQGVSALSGYVLRHRRRADRVLDPDELDPQKGLVGDAKEIQQKIVECLARQAGG
jgi:hypothetical protein